MPISQKHRLDELPLDRRIAGEARGINADQAIGAIYERREIDPTATHTKRRTGTLRSTTISPNLLGVTVDVGSGRVAIDEDFTNDLTADKWSMLCTVRIPAGATEDAVYPIAKLQGMQAQIEYDAEAEEYRLVWREVSTGNLKQTLVLGDAGDYRIAMGRLTASSRLAKWNLDNTGYVHNTLANTAWLDAESTLRLLGPIVGTTLATLEEVVITNFQFYDQTEFTESDYQTFAADLTPDTSGTTIGQTVSIATDLFTSIDDWTVGTGDVGSWTAQGATGENFRANRTDPHSNTSVIWVGSDEESGNVFDGGFNTPTVTVDPTKSYRYSVWCKQPSTNGSFMWGFANGPRKAVDTGASTNYFRVGIDLPTNDTWYLVVAYIRPHDYSGTTNDAETGIWSIGGTQYEAINFDDVKWNDASDTSAQLRTAWYSNPSDASEEVEFWNPRLELVDGTQASVSELLNPPSSTPSLDYKLLWHENFSEGGDLLSYTNSDDEEVKGYLVPTAPAAVGSNIEFGGLGTAEIPFYLDFDEYYWTTTNAAAREDWCFQLKLTTPAVLGASTIFELQDLVRLEIVNASGWKLRATFNAGGSIITHTTTLTGATSYDIFIARDEDATYLKLGATEVAGADSNPVIYAYEKTLGFVLGDKVDFQNSAPFGGAIERFALHNSSARAFGDRADAVFYFDVNSVQGDELIDQGNRALNGYLGVRSDTQPPFYREGGFPGGSFVAANGGYIISNARPNPGYTGQLRKPLLKDAVVQRRGPRAFVTSNGVNYIVDDQTREFRPLGLPRPSTKVSCSPQGVGPIDGFVRYAYRYVSTDGTVGPVFELDPCDATGGVNVLLGAQNFTTPEDPAFGLSYGECEGGTTGTSIETFVATDKDASNNQLLHKEITNPGLTLETAFRLPTVTAEARESVISQGVFAPQGINRWGATSGEKSFPFIRGAGQEATCQFTFRFTDTSTTDPNQCLFTIGSMNQHYTTGWATTNHHWNLHSLCVSLQWPTTFSGGAGYTRRALVVTRDLPGGSHHRDNDLKHWGTDVKLKRNHDYTLIVKRAGVNYGNATGADLVVALYDHTDDTWDTFYDYPGAAEVSAENFFGPVYAGVGGANIMWGTCRKEGDQMFGKTRVRTALNSGFSFNYLAPFKNGGVDAVGSNAQRMYHARLWRGDKPLQLIEVRGLERYGARQGPLLQGCETDVAFCPDSTISNQVGGWDSTNDLRIKFFAGNAFEALTVLTDSVDQTVFLGYGHSADTAVTTSTSKVPLWAAYTTRDQGSLIVGTGSKPRLSIANRKWYDGSGVRTFDEFANTIDLKQWTWLTLYFHQIERIGETGTYDVWLERVFIDGNTGEWGEFFGSDTTAAGPGGKSQNTASGDLQYLLFSMGGVNGIDTEYEVETAETRLWDGERYTAQGGGAGLETFGPYLSTRIPPNDWTKLHHYFRFVPADVDDMENQTSMKNKGEFPYTGGASQVGDATIYQGAEVKTGEETGSGGDFYFTPFPTPPLSSIRGIQIFRTQVVPYEENYPTGEPNPNAQTDAFKACRAAPLYFLSEIPDGTSFYFDSAIDTLLGAQLDLTEGLIPGNPGGIFEWDNYLGIWATDMPRIYFSASPNSWESFPQDRSLDLPLRESGPVQACVELASRDARNSRVLVLGKSWGLFLDGSPNQPRVNTLGGGVGAASSRCLVVEKGVAYAYNGTLWGITGDGACEDIGLPVLDLLPPPDKARLSVSSSLSSLYVINEETGLTLRWHFARREWFVEDRYALSTTDIDGVDNWVHVSGYYSAGDPTVYADDVQSDTALSYAVQSFNTTDDYVTLISVTGLTIGQRLTIAADEDPRIRQTVTIASFQGTRVYVNEELDLPTTSSNSLSGATITLTYTAYVGVGYWGTMLDTGQFRNNGVLNYVDMGVTTGNRWYAMSDGADFPRDPSSRAGFDSPEAHPTRIADTGGTGVSSRWGLTQRQRVQRLLVWSYEPRAVGLSELELSYSPNE